MHVKALNSSLEDLSWNFWGQGGLSVQRCNQSSVDEKSKYVRAVVMSKSTWLVQYIVLLTEKLVLPSWMRKTVSKDGETKHPWKTACVFLQFFQGSDNAFCLCNVRAHRECHLRATVKTQWREKSFLKCHMSQEVVWRRSRLRHV